MAAAALNHSPAEIVRKLFLNKGWAADAEGQYSEVEERRGKETFKKLKYVGAAWPAFANGEPDLPDSAITIYTTESKVHGRRQVGGQVEEHYGIQVRVRAARESAGWAKARMLADSLDQETDNVNVAIDGSTYLVYSIGRTTGVLSLGKEVENTKRRLYTINALMAVIML